MTLVPTRFDRDTAVTRRADNLYEARLDPGWSVVRGPNGGYVAAIILRALSDTVDDETRAPRSLTVHYAAPPSLDETVTIATTVERRGRSLSSCTARVTQGDQLVALAVGAFSAPRPGPEFSDLHAPDVPEPAAVPRVEWTPDAPPIVHRWETRFAIGRMPKPGSEPTREAVLGGWIRLEEPRTLDAPMVAAITDAMIPPVFTRPMEPFMVPTVDLTIHFRSSLPRPEAQPEDYAFAVFRTNVVAEGFLEEDGEVWSADGTLIAQSRQLAAVLPVPK